MKSIEKKLKVAECKNVQGMPVGNKILIKTKIKKNNLKRQQI